MSTVARSRPGHAPVRNVEKGDARVTKLDGKPAAEQSGRKIVKTDSTARGGGKSAQRTHFDFRDLFRRLTSLSSWTLKARFLYLTGTLLLLGSIFQILFFQHTLNKTIRSNSRERLLLLERQLTDQLERTQRFALTQASIMADFQDVKTAVLKSDREFLKTFSRRYVDTLLRAECVTGLDVLFLDSALLTILQTRSPHQAGQDLSADAMAAAALREFKPAAGVVLAPEGPEMRAVAPILDGERVAGVVMLSLPLAPVIARGVPADCGIALLLDREVKDRLAPSIVVEDVGSRVVFAGFGRTDQVLLREALSGPTLPERSGDSYLSFLPLHDAAGAPFGGLLSRFDAALQHEAATTRVYQLAGLFLSGAIFLWLFLYMNVSRIVLFFKQLKKIIIASHSEAFSERFASDHIHCLDVLNCHNDDCPVYKDPSRICYLETGSEAISPKWRNTCLYLNRYEVCANCPVYVMRKGDELAEMRNVVNTMLRLWSRFLGRTGHLLAYVLRSQEQSGRLPTLDEVSNRLEEMAKLTFFSHDVQGTLDKDEVYRQLAHVLNTYFRISRFVLFEVDHDSNRIVIALDQAEDTLCKKQVLLSTEVCRAHRVAEDVHSYYNPVLCPHFSCDHAADVRCCLPVVMGGHVGAILSFLTPRTEWEALRSEKIPILRKYLDEAAPVLSSLRLLCLSKEQALRDPLTHCHNRRFLDEFIAKYEPMSEREGRKSGLLMADLDFFKQVNDEYGHQAGDAVLKQIVVIIQANIRRSDLLIRYGGEEFIILLQNVKEDMSEKVAEKIRSGVEQAKFDLGNGVTIQKTISVGVAEYPTDGNTMYKAIKFSDVALYAAKSQGRNRVVRFKPEMWSGGESY